MKAPAPGGKERGLEKVRALVGGPGTRASTPTTQVSLHRSWKIKKHFLIDSGVELLERTAGRRVFGPKVSIMQYGKRTPAGPGIHPSRFAAHAFTRSSIQLFLRVA